MGYEKCGRTEQYPYDQLSDGEPHIIRADSENTVRALRYGARRRGLQLTQRKVGISRYEIVMRPVSSEQAARVEGNRLSSWDYPGCRSYIRAAAGESEPVTVSRRRNREARRGRTPAELHRGRCGVCMQPIGLRDEAVPAPRGSGRAHSICMLSTKPIDVDLDKSDMIPRNVNMVSNGKDNGAVEYTNNRYGIVIEAPSSSTPNARAKQASDLH